MSGEWRKADIGNEQCVYAVRFAPACPSVTSAVCNSPISQRRWVLTWHDRSAHGAGFLFGRVLREVAIAKEDGKNKSNRKKGFTEPDGEALQEVEHVLVRPNA